MSIDASGKFVWFPDARCGFAIGRLTDINQTNVTVQPVAWPSASQPTFEPAGDNSPTLEFPYASVYPCDQLDNCMAAATRRRQANPLELLGQLVLEDSDDSCALIQLNEAALLENVRRRFNRDKIYTYVAHILIAVNPYFEVNGLHTPKTIESYQGKSLGTMPPHVYAIADKAFRDMKAFKQSQSIIISGESGAGKTESQKYVLRYLCLSGSQSGRLEKLILDANPLLEAFGNAKTIRNNNSSRFGKFIEIHYEQKFTVCGGLFFHYLLEKSRICTQSNGERNYHIFYQLCACLNDKQFHELQLDAPDKFHYLNGGCVQYFCSTPQSDASIGSERKSAAHLNLGAIQDQLIDDTKCYAQTDQALSNFGLSFEQKFAIYSIVAAVLHLGNVNFCDSDQDDRSDQDVAHTGHNRAGGCRIEPSSERSLQIVARLIGLDSDLLRQALVSRIMSTQRAGNKGTVYMVQLSTQQAQAARDALAKAIYSKLFDYIVMRIVNKSIPFKSTTAPYYIGVLDVAGFEYFQHNSFEQFLINFCNEKLQQFFNERILKEEQQIYEKEGLNLRRVEFIDNVDCIELFETKSSGIFDLLDEESRLPKPSATHFTQSVHMRNKSHFRLALPRTSKLKAHREIRDDEGFLVRHFAGAVCYETSSFIEKNNDALHASLKSLMLEADNELLRELFQQQASVSTTGDKPTQPLIQATNFHLNGNATTTSTTSSNKLNFISVGTNFRSQLNDLMRKLHSTGSHFIRCIKPNSDMVAHKFEGSQILSQLHCSGMDSVLKLMQQGYPSRLSFNDLHTAYKRFMPPELERLDSHLFCRALFKAIGLSDQDFRFGSSKVFFKPAKFAEFDQIIKTSDNEHMRQLIARVSSWLVRARWRKLAYCSWSTIKLREKIHYRRKLIVCLQKNWRAALVIQKIKFRLQACKQAHQLIVSLHEFEQITRQQLKASSERAHLEHESHLLRQEIEAFANSLKLAIQQHCEQQQHETNNNNNKSHAIKLDDDKLACARHLDLLRTKRDLLIRSIKDKIAKQKELIELERQVAEERAQREREELARQRDLELKRQRAELETRRLQAASTTNENENESECHHRQQLVDSATDPMSLVHFVHASTHTDAERDQEQRDHEIAMRLAAAGNLDVQLRHPAPSENYSSRPAGELEQKYNLTKWKYSDLRDTINTSCDLELLEACKREFHRRLKVYHAWRALNSQRINAGNQSLLASSSQNNNPTNGTTTTSQHSQRAPNYIMNQSTNDDDELTRHQDIVNNEQRFFRIPFVKPQQQQQQNANVNQRGWWFAHFDGQWIARQLELHPNREPILLIAGQHDIDMCELSLSETRLTSKRGAEILAQEFELEWQKHGGEPYVSRHTSTNK